MPQYAILIFEATPAAELPPEILEAHGAVDREMVELGGQLARRAWRCRTADTATSIRDDLLTDGPFIETKEGLAGMTVIEARDLDHALELAKLVADREGGVEVRPLLGFEVARLTAIEQAVAEAHRREWAFVLAATVRVTRDLDAAEDAVQDAYVSALTAWARDGVPGAPGRVADDRRAPHGAQRARARQHARRPSSRCCSSPTPTEPRRGRRRDPRRPPAARLHLLPPGARARGAGGADAAAGVRRDDRRDRRTRSS